MFHQSHRVLSAIGLLPLLILIVGCGADPVTTTSVPKDKTAQERQERRGAPDSPSSAPSMTQNTGPFAADELHWATPAGWQVLPAEGMRLVSLRSPGDGDFSLIVLPDSPDLNNVNRWLEQIGRAPVGPEGLATLRETLTTPIGDFHLYQLEGESPAAVSILAAIHRRDRHAIFFRMQGPRATIREQRPYFDGFLRGFHFAVDHQTGLIRTPDEPAPAGGI